MSLDDQFTTTQAQPRSRRQRPATVAEVNGLRDAGRHSIGGGLILNVTPTGGRSWVARVRDVDGRRRDIGLGPYPEVTLGEAREKVLAMRREARSGQNILSTRERRRALRPKLAFRDAAIKAHAEKKRAWKNGKHQDQWLTTLENYVFGALGETDVAVIDGPAIVRALRPIWLEKPETARRVRQRIATVLNWSHANGFRASEAPMSAVADGLAAQPAKNGHFEAMPYPELPAFVAKIRGEAESMGKLALLFTILTAARSGEVRGAQWDEFDFDAHTWTVPAARMKGGRLHIVPLSDAAFEIVQMLHRNRASEFVFFGSKKQPLSDGTLTKVLRDKGLSYTVHGFRSSFRDWTAETMAVPGEVAEAALAHTIPNKVEAAYRRTNFLEQRHLLMQAWANFLSARDANVVLLKTSC
jgi:integrase